MNRRALEHLVDNYSEIIPTLVPYDGELLKYIQNPPFKLCVNAVTNTWDAFPYVPKDIRTKEFWKRVLLLQKEIPCNAVMNIIINEASFSEEEWIELLKFNVELYKYCPLEKKTSFITKLVHTNGLILKNLSKVDYKLITEAVKQNGLALEFVGFSCNRSSYKPSYKPSYKHYIYNQEGYINICEEAVLNNYDAIKYIENHDIMIKVFRKIMDNKIQVKSAIEE